MSSPASETPGDLAARVALRLLGDPELRDAFERTPGKVAQQLGIAPHDVAAVLAALTDG